MTRGKSRDPDDQTGGKSRDPDDQTGGKSRDPDDLTRWVGRSYETAPFEVTEQSIRDYMAAVGDLREEDDLIAPPTYAMVYGFDAYRQLWTDQEVALDVAHLVHGEQRFTFQRPVRPGDRIKTTGRLTAINSRGEMELVTFELKARDAEDRLVSDGTALFIIRKP